MKRLTEQEQLKWMSERLQYPWKLKEEQISLMVSMHSMQEVHELLTRLSRVSYELNHHPDTLVSVKHIEVSLTTHDANGLTLLDFQYAQEVEQILDNIERLRTI
jgi:4a-hydroxytetrahydrobiopterin dehydratase